MWLQLIFIACLIAALPLSIVWASKDQNRYRKLILVTAFLTFDLIMFGAFTRLTDSGLGCPDWPGCYGEANPFSAHADIHAEQTANPHGPVTHFKAWVEMVHRYLAMAVGVLIVAQMIIAWMRRKQFEGAPVFATALFVFVCIQGAFGMWTVTLKLQPAIVTLHLLFGMGLLAMLVWLAERLRVKLSANLEQPSKAKRKLPSPLGERGWGRGGSTGLALFSTHTPSPPTPLPEGRGEHTVWPARVAWLIVMLQIALGGWVSTNYAVLACTDYPLCQGALIPHMDFKQGFSLWRDLGMTAHGEYLSFAALTAIHWVHRNFALLVVISSGYLAFKTRHCERLRYLSKAIFIVLLVQVLTGFATILFAWPLPIAVLHNGGAALLLALLTMVNYRVRSRHE